MANHYSSAEILAKNIIAQVGKTIVIGVPLGIAKPIHFLNAIYRLASSDSTIKLTIITGLTLARPKLKNDIKGRLMRPIIDRLIGDYVDPLYEIDREKNQIPENIKIFEFFLNKARYLHHPYAQQNYISSKYTDILRDSFARGMNVVAQQVYFDRESDCLSLSSSADLYHDAVAGLRTLEKEGEKIAIVAEVNQNLPPMLGNALIKTDVFTHILDTNSYPKLFALPREAISWQDHAIGLYASTLIKDDGCLQMGIGALSNSVTNAVLLRHERNEIYQNLINELLVDEKGKALEIFSKGLYASTEMLCDGYVYLINANIIKKLVYDDLKLQTLLNQGLISDKITTGILKILYQNEIINEKLTRKDVNYLKYFGIFKAEVEFEIDHLAFKNQKFPIDLTSGDNLNLLENALLGDKLQNGRIAHAGFFVGSNDFYEKLKKLPKEKLLTIEMTGVSRTNALLRDPQLYIAQRKAARFINTCMMLTLGGEVVSNGLKEMQQLSGVGGQFDFVNMASGIPDARSIILCRSTRKVKDEVVSNIIWEYNHITIPRYLRDIFITEYGIADCRSKTDAEVIKAMLNVTDSRFQIELLKKAKSVNKIEHDYQIPEKYRQNYPDRIKHIFEDKAYRDFLNPYPFGSDLTKIELTLQQELSHLNKANRIKKSINFINALLYFENDETFAPYLERLNLKNPQNLKDWGFKKMIKYRLRKHAKKNLLEEKEEAEVR